MPHEDDFDYPAKTAHSRDEFEPRFHGYHDLMLHKIRHILLVSSLYDAFILEEDGQLSEQLYGRYQDLELSSPPRVTRVSSGNEALEELDRHRYDLVITMTRLVDLDPYEFGRRAKGLQPDIPVILLVTDTSDIPHYHFPGEHEGIDKVFFWTGDSTLFLAIVKYVEDKLNVESDTRKGMVRVILVIEDSTRYYSMFLPILFTAIMRQTSALVAEGLNEHEKLLRRRARPKILLAETYEEAMDIYEGLRENILGVITDINFPHGGEKEIEAGLKVIEQLDKDCPVIVQSSKPEVRETVEARGIPFLDKNSTTLGQDLRTFFEERLGFGEFVFRLQDGTEVARASNMRDFIRILEDVPGESLLVHGVANQFSNWLMARGEFELASVLRPKRVSDFDSVEDIRMHLIRSFKESRQRKQQGIITDFSQQDFEFQETFTRFGGGSLGGKGRGIAFLTSLIHQSDLRGRFPGARIRVPDTLVITTEEFDRFVEQNDVGICFDMETPDGKILECFEGAELSIELRDALAEYLSHVRVPIAVRSSSLLEDSQNQPFAGIYSTYILPNNHRDDGVRLGQLSQAIKLVYASTFYRTAKAYIDSTVHKSGEEKMAVVVQKLVGNEHGNRFYPLFSGVAQSYNFYPVSPMRREDGIVNVALGLGKIVVEGGKVLSFSPKNPRVLPGMSSVEDVLNNAQDVFYSLNLSKSDFDLSEGEDTTLLVESVASAEGDGTLAHLASTYDANDNRLRAGLSHSGPRVITFSGVLKYDAFPLHGIIDELLSIGARGMGGPVELEFAVSEDEDGELAFNVLQIRPFITRRERDQVEVEPERDWEGSIVYSERALGNGLMYGIRDIVYVPPASFDKAHTLEMASEIGSYNSELAGSPYLLIGPGRWGTRDRWLGIPVGWEQISGAKAIVETSLKDFKVDPSNGTHFFHNITCLGIAYLTVSYGARGDRIDWEWLEAREPASQGRFVRHIKLDEPVLVKVDGRSGRGVILAREGSHG